MTLTASVRAHMGAFEVHAQIDAHPGEVVAVLGPNGSGKSTLLGVLAGHIPVDEGHVTLAARTLDGDGVHLPPVARRVGLLGQRALLFPHLSVLENVAFGLRAQGIARADAHASAREWLDRVDLPDHEQRRPAALSGGQQQRVALARAFAARPEALLLDEPFAALDVQTSAQARRIVANLRDRAEVPMVLVTHDPLDAIVLAARTAVLQEGRIVQFGPTAEVLGHPRTPFVAALAGMNLVAGVADDDGCVAGDSIRWRGRGDRPEAGRPATVAFAPGAVRARVAEAAPAAPNRWTGTVDDLEPIPGGVRVLVREHPGIPVDCASAVAVAVGIAPGMRLQFSVDPDDVSVRATQ